MKEHYHCKRCGKVLKETPKYENKISYFCDDCLPNLQFNKQEILEIFKIRK